MLDSGLTEGQPVLSLPKSRNDDLIIIRVKSKARIRGAFHFRISFAHLDEEQE